MNRFKKLLLQTSVLAVALVFAMGLQYAYAWTGPTGTAPANNVAAPINTSSTAQSKDGALAIFNNLFVYALDMDTTPSGSLSDGIRFSDGTVQTTAGGGAVVKVASTMSTATALGSVAIPYDDTIPQISEGTEFMTLSYTPTSAANNLLVQVVLNGAPETGPAEDGAFTVALFRDAVVNALAATSIDSYDSEQAAHAIPLTYVMSAGGTTPITFRVRAGTGSVNNYRFNGIGGTRKLGGVLVSSITVTEFKP